LHETTVNIIKASLILFHVSLVSR